MNYVRGMMLAYRASRKAENFVAWVGENHAIAQELNDASVLAQELTDGR